jgi:hypothetical protein
VWADFIISLKLYRFITYIFDLFMQIYSYNFDCAIEKQSDGFFLILFNQSDGFDFNINSIFAK